jgi:demethylmenaquinone methyltransferase/2-methoxy-6-polyprenyl-1,4-benzoquinol methylase
MSDKERGDAHGRDVENASSPDNRSYIQSLLVFDPLRDSIIRNMIKALHLPAGSHGLDAGCGIGLQCLLLADEVGTTGHVTGLDVSAEMLDYGREMVKKAGLSDRISFQEGDVTRLPFDEDTFDWVWSADCVGYGPWKPVPLLTELARVVKPGGIVAIGAWSSEELLPGYPRLEARLRATSAGIAPFIHGKRPELHFFRALGWFRELGFQEPRAKVFADSVFAPLSDEIRRALAALFDMRWPGVSTELSSDDFAEFQRLCLPDSPDFILNLPDYYAFFSYSMFWGKVADQIENIPNMDTEKIESF